MTGKEYADLIASYLVQNYGPRRVQVYREVRLGRTIIAKNRKVDILVINHDGSEALAFECKYQEGQGTADGKITYALQDLEALPLKGCVVYAGDGFSQGVVHMLEASPNAARCLPSLDLTPSEETSELDHLLAVTFRWWDVLTEGKQQHQV